MCEECHCSPCLSGCPNASDPPTVARCHRCGEAIIPGDEYAVINGMPFCECCIDDMSYCELITLCGHDWRTASKEDIYDGYNG